MSIRGSATAEASSAAETAGGAPRPAWLLLLRHRSAAVGISLLAVMVLLSLVGPLLLPADAYRTRLADAFAGAGTAGHLLGTDDLGRDELIRLLLGARITLSLGLAAIAIGLAVGVPLGAISGFYGGWIDLVLQRLTDVLLSFPGILLALALVASLGVGVQNVIISVGITSIPGFVRLVRASTLSLRERAFVEAARSIGVPDWLILLRHVVPNCLAPVTVQATLQIGGAILVAAGLGFLGLGIQQPTPEWGSMLGYSRNYIFSDPLLVTVPGLAIFVAVLAFNLVGDGLRDVLDPRLR